jgi:hypothetical protein
MTMFPQRLLRPLAVFLMLAIMSGPAWSASPEATSPATPTPAPATGAPESAAPPAVAFNTYARFIAGLSQPQGPLAACEQQPAWLRYAKSVNRSWRIFQKRQLAHIREWAARELAAISPATVFYPFSGPDFVNVHAFFPRARNYLMIALEPVGDLPDCATLNDYNFFGPLQRSLYELLQLNFFLTKKMKTSLRQQELQGILPVLLFFLAREDLQVLDIRHWLMQGDGAIVETSILEKPPAAGRQGIPGVRLVFTRGGGAPPQTLYYFQANLHNYAFKRNQHFLDFLKVFGPLTTFAKAASYLMFKEGYADIRRFILEQSRYVLQTDSAIPLKFFAPQVWNFRFFGTYSGPIALFSNRYQQDLARAYENCADIGPLPFGIGYRHRLRTSNLMFASRKTPSLTTPGEFP